MLKFPSEHEFFDCIELGDEGCLNNSLCLLILRFLAVFYKGFLAGPGTEQPTMYIVAYKSVAKW
jgi:hypothetical protein